jgi:hypothetical protein
MSWYLLMLSIITQILGVAYSWKVFRLTPFILSKSSWSLGWLIFMISLSVIFVRRAFYMFSFDGCHLPDTFFVIMEQVLTLIVTTGLLLFSYIMHNFFKRHKIL